jgi:hypothetical protein
MMRRFPPNPFSGLGPAARTVLPDVSWYNLPTMGIKYQVTIKFMAIKYIKWL